MPTTTIAKRMYFSKPRRTTGSTTKRRKMVSMASRESQAIVADKTRASAKEAPNKAMNIAGTPGPTFHLSSVDYCANNTAPQPEIPGMFPKHALLPKHHATDCEKRLDLRFCVRIILSC